MGFQDNIPGIYAKAFNQVGAPAVYTPVSGDSVPCRVNLRHDVMLQPSSYDARVVETGSTITALFSDVGEPRENSTFEIDGVTWTVKRVTDNNRILVTVAVV